MNNNKVRTKYNKHWCFTLNNYTENEYKVLGDCTLFTYCIAGKEGKDEGKTPHLQGYMCLNKRTSRRGVRNIFKGAHWEVKYATISKAIEYCKKEGDYEEWGTVPMSGSEATKRKWESIYDNAKKGDFESIPKDILFRYYGNAKKIRMDNPTPIKDNLSMDNYWIVGPTGNGKTKFVHLKYKSVYYKQPNKWWDGY